MKLLAYYLTLLLIFVIPWENSFSFQGVGTIAKVVGLALALVWGMGVLWSGEFRRPRLFQLAFIAFVCWNVLSLMWSADRDTSQLQVLTWIQLGGLVLILWDQIRTEKQVRQALHAFVCGCWVTSGALIYNFMTGAGTEMERYSADGFNPNIVAVIVSMGLPLSWYLAMTARSRILKAAYYCYVPLGVLTVLLTGSRGGLVGLVPVVIYVMLNSPLRAPAVRIGLVCAIICGLVAAPYLLPENTQERLRGTYSSFARGDMGGRGQAWMLAVPIFMNHPVAGVGIGAFESVHPSRLAPHNIFLSVLVETGVIGLAFLLLVLAALYFELHKQPSAERSLWFAVGTVLLLGALVRNLEDCKQTWLVLSLLTVSASAVATQVRSKTLGSSKRLPVTPLPAPVYQQNGTVMSPLRPFAANRRLSQVDTISRRTKDAPGAVSTKVR